MAEKGITTLTGLAVTLVALSRFLAIDNPALGAHLKASLTGAEKAGISAEDLQLLKTVIEAVSVPSKTAAGD